MGVINYRFICNKKNPARYDNVKIQNDKIKALWDIEYDNIEECVFPAIMADQVDASSLYRNVEFPTFLTPGEVGCALSHLTVYKDFLATEFEYMYIFEDDSVVNAQLFTKKFTDDVGQLISNYGDKGLVLLLQSASNTKRTGYQLGDCKVYRVRESYCTHGYVINRQAAKKILELHSPIKFEIDIFKYYYWLGLMDIYALDANVVSIMDGAVCKSNICSLGSRELCRNRQKMQYAKYKSIEVSLTFMQRMRAWLLRLEKNICKFF